MSKKKKTTPVVKKSEFWVTAVMSLAGLLLAFGVITPEQSDSIVRYVPNLIGAVMSILSTMNFVGVQHAAKVEVFRAMCAVNLDKDGQFKAQSGTPEEHVGEVAEAVGL